MDLDHLTSHPIRDRILELLTGREMRPVELQEKIGAEFGTHLNDLYRHLRLLRENALVEIRHEGVAAYYRAVLATRRERASREWEQLLANTAHALDMPAPAPR